MGFPMQNTSVEEACGIFQYLQNSACSQDILFCGAEPDVCGVGFAERKTAAHDFDAHEVAKRSGSFHFEQSSADETEVGKFFDSTEIFRDFHDNAAGANGKLVE